METGLRIEGGVSKENAKHTSEMITQIFKAGFDYRMDQKTIRAALETACEANGVNGTTISGCEFRG